MSVIVEVRLLSGRAATIEAGLGEELEALTLRAQAVLGVTKGRLVDSSEIFRMLAHWSGISRCKMVTH